MFVVALLVGLLAVAATPNDWGLHGYAPDGSADKYTTKAAWDGTGAYDDMNEVFNRYGLEEIGGAPIPIPRPPGAFILHGPLAVVPDASLIPIVGIVSVVSIVITCWVAARISGTPPAWLAVAAIVIAAGTNYWPGNPGFVIPPLIAVGWLAHREGKSRWSGMLVGTAAAVKAWPLIIVAALVLRRETRLTAVVAVITVFLFTALGLLLPGVTIEGAAMALLDAGREFVGSEFNRSLAGLATRVGLEPMIGSGVALLLWVWFMWTYRSTDLTIALSIVAGLLASPLAWSFYWIAAIPAAAVLAEHLRRGKHQRSPLIPDLAGEERGPGGAATTSLSGQLAR